MKLLLTGDEILALIRDQEKERRRRRYEQRTGSVHLRGGRRQNTRHKGRGRPQCAPHANEWN